MTRNSLRGYQGSPLLIHYLDHAYRRCDNFEALILKGRTFRRIAFFKGLIHSKDLDSNQWLLKDSDQTAAFRPIGVLRSDGVSTIRLFCCIFMIRWHAIGCINHDIVVGLLSELLLNVILLHPYRIWLKGYVSHGDRTAVLPIVSHLLYP